MGFHPYPTQGSRSKFPFAAPVSNRMLTMKTGPVLAVVAATIGLAAVLTAFAMNASPYVTVAEAKATTRSNVHLPGDIVEGTVKVLHHDGEVHFTLRDEEGVEIPVIHHGNPPANMGEATKVVVVGEVENGAFQSNKMILKCPSRYESEGEKA